MRQKIDVPHLYRQALKAIPKTMEGLKPEPLGAMCPMTLDQLLADEDEDAHNAN